MPIRPHAYDYKRRGVIIGFVFPFGQTQAVVAYRYDTQTETGLFACKTIPLIEGPFPTRVFKFLQGSLNRRITLGEGVESVAAHSAQNASDWPISVRGKLVGQLSLIAFMHWPVVDVLYKREDGLLLTRLEQLGHGEDLWKFRDNDIDTLHSLTVEDITDPPPSWNLLEEL